MSTLNASAFIGRGSMLWSLESEKIHLTTSVIQHLHKEAYSAWIGLVPVAEESTQTFVALGEELNKSLFFICAIYMIYNGNSFRGGIYRRCLVLVLLWSCSCLLKELILRTCRFGEEDIRIKRPGGCYEYFSYSFAFLSNCVQAMNLILWRRRVGWAA